MAKGLDYVINLLDGSSRGVDKAKSKIGEVDTAIAGAENRVSGLGSVIGKIGGIMAGVFAAGKVIEFGKESIEVAKSIRMATAQVAQGIQTTGGAAGLTLEQLNEQAEKLQHTTLFSKSAILSAQSMLLSFTAIKGAIFNDAIPSIMGLATRMGGEGPADLKGALLQVSKAMQDPARNLGRLQRSGVDFTEAQTKLIEGLAQHNHMAEAQKLILAEVNKEFGGSAEAARKAAGPQADLKEAYEKLQEAVGPLIQNGIAPLVTALAGTVTKATEFVGKYNIVVDAVKNGYQWVKDNADIFKDLAIGIGLSTAAVLIANPTIIAYGASMAADAVISGALTIATVGMTVAQWALNAALTANPIGAFIVVVGAAIGGLIIWYQHSKTMRAVLAGIGETASVLIDVFVGLGKAIIGAFTFNPNLIKDGLKQSAGAVLEIQQLGFAGIFAKGAASSIKADEIKEKQEKVQKAASKVGMGNQHATIGVNGTKPTNSLTGKATGTVGGGSESVSGGKSVKNVTITFQSMIKEFTQNVTNLKGQDGIGLKRIITQLLAEAAADSEILIGE